MTARTGSIFPSYVYLLDGDYAEPYEIQDRESSLPEYRTRPPIKQVLGIYYTEEEAKKAKANFESYREIFEDDVCDTAMKPYHNIRYRRVPIGDHVRLR